jgi:UDP-glucose 4-epimerase
MLTGNTDMAERYSGFDNTKVLVVGGAGFVGSNLVKMLLSSSPSVKVVVVDNLMSAERVNVPNDPRCVFYAGSITETSILRQIQDHVDYIFHLATYHGNQSSIHDPLEDHANNTYTTLRLFDWIKDFKNLKKVVYSSAGCSVAKKTFDDATETTEEDPIEIKQDSPYSISKIIGEFYAVYYFNQHKVPTVRARFQNVYGPGEILGAGRWRGTYATVWRNVTPTFVYKALHGLPIPLENSGVATRDFIFVDDICRGLIACALKGAAGDVYNIASGKETTIAQLAETIVELAGSKSKVEYLPKRAWDNSGKRYGSTEKSKNVLGFEALTEHRSGLLKTIEWTRANVEFIQECMDKHNAFMK